jgi:hypothetical protein
MKFLSNLWFFELISSGEKSLLTKAISESQISCCSSSDKPIDKVLGFVKRSPLNANGKK